MLGTGSQTTESTNTSVESGVPWRTTNTSSPELDAVSLRMELPLPEYHLYQGDTNDCGPYSLCIVANALLNEQRFDPRVVAGELNTPAFSTGPFPLLIVRRIPNWATFPWGITDYLKQKGFQAQWSLRNTKEKLIQNLHDQVATIIMIGEPFKIESRRYAGWAHVKPLYAYEPSAGFAFVDPGYEKNPNDPWESQGIFWQDEASFLSLWSKMLRIVIEISK